MEILACRGVRKIYGAGAGQVTALDGISLTVAAVDRESFSVSTIPHTVSQTNLHDRCEGELVNLETDIIGKYIEKLIRGSTAKKPESAITEEFLLRCGF